MKQLLAGLMLLMWGGAGILADTHKETDTAAEVARIQQLYADYRGAVEAGSIAGYLDVLHPQVRLMPPGAPAIDGAERYAGFLQPVFATAAYRIEVISLPQIVVLGDAAVAEYDYVIHLSLKNPDVGITEQGALSSQRTRSRYFDVLRKKDDGEWAVWRHTWSVFEESSSADVEDGGVESR